VHFKILQFSLVGNRISRWQCCHTNSNHNLIRQRSKCSFNSPLVSPFLEMQNALQREWDDYAFPQGKSVRQSYFNRENIKIPRKNQEVRWRRMVERQVQPIIKMQRNEQFTTPKYQICFNNRITRWHLLFSIKKCLPTILCKFQLTTLVLKTLFLLFTQHNSIWESWNLLSYIW
jgi:hypothetical protein